MSRAKTFEGNPVINQPFDEEFVVEDGEDIATSQAVSPMPSRSGQGRGLDERGDTPPDSPTQSASEYESEQLSPGHDMSGTARKSQGESRQREEEETEETVSEGSASESMSETDNSEGPPLEGAYDPAEYANLPVGDDIKELFEYIGQYKPETQELDTRLRPFIPDYIPAVGDIDAFIKIPRVSGDDEMLLGLEVLDEPCAEQSDPTVLDLHLRILSKMATNKQVVVKQVPNAEKNTKAIDSWITSIAKVHREKEPPTVQYSSPMPDIETLMQVWPPEFEEALKTTQLPSAELDVSIKEYTDIVCALVDIPVQKSRIEALHVLCTLYSEFKESAHFKALEEKTGGEGDGEERGGASIDGPQTMSFDMQ